MKKKETFFETNDGRSWVVVGLRVYLIEDGSRSIHYVAKNKNDLEDYILQLKARFI